MQKASYTDRQKDSFECLVWFSLKSLVGLHPEMVIYYLASLIIEEQLVSFALTVFGYLALFSSRYLVNYVCNFLKVLSLVHVQIMWNLLIRFIACCWKVVKHYLICCWESVDSLFHSSLKTDNVINCSSVCTIDITHYLSVYFQSGDGVKPQPHPITGEIQVSLLYITMFSHWSYVNCI